MPIDINKTLRSALKKLNLEKGRIERQITALQNALEATNRRGAPRGRVGRKRGRRRMGPTARKAISQRMKAYWAKRRGQAKGSVRSRGRSRRGRSASEAEL